MDNPEEKKDCVHKDNGDAGLADHDAIYVESEKEKVERESDANSTDDSGSNVDFSVWDYTPDKSSNIASASQPCFSIRGISYTPPGWKRKYKHSRPSDDEHDTDDKEKSLCDNDGETKRSTKKN